MAISSPIAVGADPGALVEVKAPDSVSWGLQDVSSSDAGRVQDASATMYKNRFAQKRKLQLSWTNPTLAEASAILRAFNPEYVFIRYVDAMDGGYAVREFYVGDRSAPLREVRDPLTGSVLGSLSFDVIER